VIEFALLFAPLPFKEVIADVLKVKPPEKSKPQKSKMKKNG
jgi:hypothetical protein